MALWPRKKFAAAAESAKGHHVYVGPAGEHWIVRVNGHFENKGSAVLVGRAIAQLLDLQFEIRGEDGRIQEADSSGDAPDPGNIPG